MQAFLLAVEVHAADHAHHLQVGVVGQQFGVLLDLHRQLPGGRDDQRPRFAGVARHRDRVAQQVVDDGDQEGGGLAGAGLRPPDGVGAGQRVGQHLGLDRRAILKTGVRDAVHQRRLQVKVVEAGFAFFFRDLELLQAPFAGGFVLHGFARFGCCGKRPGHGNGNLVYKKRAALSEESRVVSQPNTRMRLFAGMAWSWISSRPCSAKRSTTHSWSRMPMAMSRAFSDRSNSRLLSLV